jgi:cell division topological specificity factor
VTPRISVFWKKRRRASLADCSGVKHVIIGLFSFQQETEHRTTGQRAVADHRGSRAFIQRGPDYLPQLKQDILDVIRKYVQIDPDKITVQLDQKSDELSVLELNITFADDQKKG